MSVGFYRCVFFDTLEICRRVKEEAVSVLEEIAAAVCCGSPWCIAHNLPTNQRCNGVFHELLAEIIRCVLKNGWMVKMVRDTI